MMSASIAGRLPARSRLGHPLRRRPRLLLHQPALGQPRLPMGAIAVSAMGHVLFFSAVTAVVMWTAWNHPKLPKLYVVNLVPAVAAVGAPSAPPTPSLPARAVAPAPPARAPAPEPAPREPAPREPTRLPEPSWSTPRLPAPRAAPPRPGDKELPALAGPRVADVAPTARPDKIDKPVENRPAPSATLGQPTGSVAGMGALSMDASDFPHAWYLRQVLQKVQGQWQRQNRKNEPDQKPLVLVEIQRDGSIRTPKIEQSSGNTLYDQAALRAVVDASPFPPLPQDWSKPSLRVMFRFDLIPARG